MKEKLLLFTIILFFNLNLFSQTNWGTSGSRTENRDDAGLQGNSGAISGFFQTSNPINYPQGASSWWHLLDVRHSNPDNNFAMQFAGRFFDQNLFFRKTDNNPSTSWSRVLLESDGKVGIGTTSPAAQLQIKGNLGFDSSTQLLITNNASAFGRTHLVLTGRFHDGNDAWTFGGGARNAIIFAQNENSSNLGIGAYGSEKFSLQLEGNSNSLGFLSQANGNNPNLVLTQNGRVGIGTTTPEESFEIKSASPVQTFHNPGIASYKIGLSGSVFKISAMDNGFGGHNGNFQNNISNSLTINQNGNVGVGTITTNDYKLAVAGKVIAEEVKVKLQAAWPDYVFNEDYKLTPLSEIQSFIKTNKHLPEVPSAKEMETNGINLSEMNMLLLKKVEELTLHIIKQEERIKKLENQKVN